MVKQFTFFFLSLMATTVFAGHPRTEKLTVILDQTPNPTHAPIVIAKQQGYFKEQGLNVQLIHPQKPSDPLKWLMDKKADIGLVYEPWLIEYVDRGSPMIRIGTLIDKPLNCIIALQRSGIKSLNDLKGKEIGSSNNRMTSAILTTLLERQGFSHKDIKLIHVNANLREALLSKKVDAISGTLRNLEVPQLEANGNKVVVFFPEEHGIPNYSELVFITHTAYVKDPRFPRFLAAIKKAVRFIDEHPRQAWAEVTKQLPYLNNELNKAYWFATLPYFAEDPAALDREEWQHFADFMRQNQLISKTQPVSRYAIAIG